jgi:hypothetical protein
MTALIWLLLSCTKDEPTGDTDTNTGDTDEAENQAPVAVDDSAETTAGQVVSIDVLDNDDDPDGDDIDITGVTQGEHGFVEIDGNEVTYEPLDDTFVGVDTFTYTVDDGNGGTDEATVAVNVKEPPTIVIVSPEDGATIAAGSTLTVTFEVDGCSVSSPGNDPEGCHGHKWLDGSTWALSDGTGHGVYAEGSYEMPDVAPGEHVVTLKLALNDGSDGLWEPEISDSITVTIEAP